MKIYHYAKVMETNLNREHFTQHGLHMNRLGKELISRIISENMKSILMRKQPPPPNQLKMERRLHGSQPS
jgi:hypothetical protein